MILVGFSIGDVLIGMLWVSLVLLLVFIGYRQLLRYMSRGAVDKKDFCSLETIEDNPASGEIPFYFSSDNVKAFKLSILDAEMNVYLEVKKGDCLVGGNIIRFDSSKLPNGEYFYSLKTENQKIVKKMKVQN